MSDINSPEVKLIRMIGALIVKVDELRSVFDLENIKRKRLDILRDKLDAHQRTIIIYLIDINTEKFKEHTGSLKKINKELENTIDDLTKFADTLKNLVNFVEVVGKIAGIASSVIATPAVAPAMLARSVLSVGVEEKAFFEEKSVEALTEAIAEKKTAPVPAEEVLYGVELTPEKLIITVATGGCTGEDSFHIDVNKGFTGLPPYFVTVYRIVPDNCKGNFEPMKVAFSRKTLGLEGTVEFILRNKIGNTSNHRLTS